MPRIVRFHRFGGPEVLQIEDMPSAVPGPGEVRLSVEAFALNRADQLFRERRHSVVNGPLPARIGYEAVGRLNAIGAGVTGWRIGDRVATLPNPSPDYGVYGEEAVVPATTLMRVADDIPAEQATATWLQYMTAWGGLMVMGALQPGQWLLVTAGSSGSAIGAIQMAKEAGARVIATTRGDAKADFIQGVGADHVVVTDRQDWAATVRSLTDDHGVALVYDCVGGALIEPLIGACAWQARYILYGTLGGPCVLPMIPAALKEITIRPYSMPTVFGQAAFRQAGLDYIAARVEDGRLRPVVGARFTLDRIVEAHRYLESNQTCGKIVVLVAQAP